MTTATEDFLYLGHSRCADPEVLEEGDVTPIRVHVYRDPTTFELFVSRFDDQNCVCPSWYQVEDSDLMSPPTLA
jgi:hypothetical protein